MGLFDKKKDDFGSPVERVDLGPIPAKKDLPAPGPIKSAPLSGPLSTPLATPPRGNLPPEDVPRYGINQAIELMRSLPGDNVELVVQVVKRTLESTQIHLDTIIQDASRKQAEIETRVAILKQEIAELEQEIGTRRAEITRLDADHRETTLVKDRLVLAEKLGNTATTPVVASGAQVHSSAVASGAQAVPLHSPGAADREAQRAIDREAQRATDREAPQAPRSTDRTVPSSPRVSGAHATVSSPGQGPLTQPLSTGPHQAVQRTGDEPHPAQKTGAMQVTRGLPGGNPPKR